MKPTSGSHQPVPYSLHARAHERLAEKVFDLKDHPKISGIHYRDTQALEQSPISFISQVPAESDLSEVALPEAPTVIFAPRDHVRQLAALAGIVVTLKQATALKQTCLFVHRVPQTQAKGVLCAFSFFFILNKKTANEITKK